MTKEPPSPDVRSYVKNHREDIRYLLQHGDQTTRALALAVLIEGGEDADIEIIQKELELIQEMNENS